MPKRPKVSYEMEAIYNVITEVQVNDLRATAKRFSVPRTNLLFRVKNPGHKDSIVPSRSR